MDEEDYESTCRQLAPIFTSDKYKGQAGIIGVFGGSLEQTGAPYFAAITALKVGADLVHVFCAKEAGREIKSYSPELIVHPILDDPLALEKIEPWLHELHVILIGPGLGQDVTVLTLITKLISICRNVSKPLIIDADALNVVTSNIELIRNYPPSGIILTLNRTEYEQLLAAENSREVREKPLTRLNLGKAVTILRKGYCDEILTTTKRLRLTGSSSVKRCTGQGDVLAGAVSIFYAWALQHKMGLDVSNDKRALMACYAASRLTRKCSERAFTKKGRAMVCSDMIEEISGVFKEQFEMLSLPMY